MTILIIVSALSQIFYLQQLLVVMVNGVYEASWAAQYQVGCIRLGKAEAGMPHTSDKTTGVRHKMLSHEPYSRWTAIL